MDPAALEKNWRFYMFSEPATANSAMQLASENAFLKRKGNIPSLFVTDVKALVLLGFISSGGAKMESLGMAACFHGLVRGSGLLMYFWGLLCGIPRFPISVFMASSFPTFLEEADASQAPLVAGLANLINTQVSCSIFGCRFSQIPWNLDSDHILRDSGLANRT